MAEAIIRGLIHANAVDPSQICVTNRSHSDRLQQLNKLYGVRTVEGADTHAKVRELAAADVILVACKPYDVANTLETLVGKIGNPVILSVAAGISIPLMESVLGGRPQVVRAMPNTACAVLQSATAVAFGQYCTEEAKRLSQEILSLLGTVSVVEESKMDVVTGVSGSGPAYFYYMVEAMQQAAESMGLSPETARTLVLQTMTGAAKMLQETGLDARELRRQVTSPNGTTMAGIRALEEADFKELIERTISRAAERSKEMGEQQASLLVDRKL